VISATYSEGDNAQYKIILCGTWGLGLQSVARVTWNALRDTHNTLTMVQRGMGCQCQCQTLTRASTRHIPLCPHVNHVRSSLS